MANITIYVDDELAARVKAADLSVSKVCQQALKRELRLIARNTHGQTPPKHGRPAGRQPGDW